MDALQALNAFPGSASSDVCDAQRILWESASHQPQVTKHTFLQSVAALKLAIESTSPSRWLLYSEHPARFAAGFIALTGLNRTVVLCSSKQPGWLARISDRFDAVLTDENLDLKECPVFNLVTPCTEAPAPFWWPALTGNESLVFLTSGSTGKPKPISKTLKALTNEVSGLISTFGTDDGASVYAASVSHLHIYGLLFRLLLPLICGCRSIIEIVEYHEQLQKLSQQHDEIVFVSSPAFLSHLDVSLPGIHLSAVYSSGGPLGLEAAQNAKNKLNFLPIEVYGSTETGGIAWRQQETPQTPWQLFSGVKLTLNQGDVEIISPNMPGEAPYTLDDKIRFVANGRILLEGRKDRIEKIGEKRISLTEVEQFLEGMPDIERCIALVTGDPRKILACAVQLSSSGLAALSAQGESALINTWKATMRERFEAVTIPRKWRLVTRIPLNTQGKIDNQSLLKMFQKTKGACR